MTNTKPKAKKGKWGLPSLLSSRYSLLFRIWYGTSTGGFEFVISIVIFHLADFYEVSKCKFHQEVL